MLKLAISLFLMLMPFNGFNRVFASVNDGLILNYQFKADAGGVAVDTSANGYTGILNGPRYVASGVIDGAYWFDGIDDYILTGSMGYQPVGTISFWMNADTVENWRNPFSTDYAGWDDCIRFEESTNRELAVGALGMGVGFYTTEMVPARWYHIVYSWDAQNGYGYLDGKNVFTTAHPDPDSSVHPDIPGTAGFWKEQSLTFRNVCVGNGYSLEPERHWKGGVDELRIYNRVITALEAKQLFYLPIVEKEANHILSCQYVNSGSSAYGAINDVPGDPTWVVPRENAMAILGLVKASQLLNDQNYLLRANQAADYLIYVQDQSDGAWYNQYNYSQPHPDGLAKSPTQTAEVMIAFYKLGYKQTRYTAMKKGAQFLMSCQNNLNKGGLDDGLICGGKNSSGQYESWRWTSDNAYAYWAFKAAEYWGKEQAALGYQSELTFAEQCKDASARVLAGINAVLRVTNVNDPDYGVWRVAVDGQHNPQFPSGKEWINYAPQMLDVPATGVGKTLVGEWIHKNLQDQSGACAWNTLDWGKNKLSPGYSFQASLSWLDLKQDSYADAALEWALGSGLWYSGGGWIDWTENGQPAADWQRFIDTSFYAIAAFSGGYDFRILDMTAPSIPVVKDAGIYTASITALSCAWRAVDLISGITGYQYKITRDSVSGPVVKNWTLTGTQTSVTAGGLALTPGKKYYFSVKARNAAGLWSGVGVSDGITVDNSPAVIPIVTDSGASTRSTASLSASWRSSDPVSGILEYQFQVTRDSPSGSILRNWASAGTKTSIVVTGLTLQAGKTYYFRVKAKNGAGLWSPIGVSNGITVVR
ncbi:MAG: LamG-like jellyroll fold domain-containing protein [Candidatus Omnitrophota bacterium]